MTPDRTRQFLRLGVLALLVAAPLPFGSVQPGFVLAIELVAAGLGAGAIVLLGIDAGARAAAPRGAIAACGVAILLGVFQIVPWPFAAAARLIPTVDLVRPLLPFLGPGHPPGISWSVAAPETTDAVLRLVAYASIGLAAATAFDSSASRRRFAGVLTASAVFQAAYGSGELLSGRQHIFAFAKKYYLDSATGTFINRNHFATLLAASLPLAMALALEGGSRARSSRRMTWRERTAQLGQRDLTRLLAAMACGLIWMGVLLSHSRAGLAAAIAGAAIVMFHFRKARAARWIGVMAVAVLLGLLTLDVAQAPGERFLAVKAELQGKAGRIAVWRDSLALVEARPVLGHGYGTFESVFPSVQSAAIDLHYDHAHNEWLEWAIEGGVVALGAALLLAGIVLWPPRTEAWSTPSDRSLSLAGRAAVAAVALHAAWDFPLRVPGIAVVTAATVGLVLAGAASRIDPAPWPGGLRSSRKVVREG